MDTINPFDNGFKNNNEDNKNSNNFESSNYHNIRPEDIRSSMYKDYYMINQQNNGQYYNQPQKKISKAKLFIFILFILLMLFMGLTFLLGKGWFGNLISLEDYHTDLTINNHNKPIVESDYYDEETGKYTPQGIGKQIMPSVVTIMSYDSIKYDGIGQGTGIILTDNGYIITNCHVVDTDDAAYLVILNNGEEYRATLVGKDSKSDLAVLKIRAENLTPAEFGNSDQLELGESVIALGSPAGLQNSLTMGVVSGIHREIQTETLLTKIPCVQIDAAINPGNSGGPLVNMYGQVVGINTSKLVDSEYDGIGFAIEINEAIPIIEKLISKGYIDDRVKIGITFLQISQAQGELSGKKPGLLINGISEDCDIANTDLKIGDTIIAIQGKEVYILEDVQDAIEGLKPGDTITATVYRKEDDSTEKTFDITFKLEQDKSYLID